MTTCGWHTLQVPTPAPFSVFPKYQHASAAFSVFPQPRCSWPFLLRDVLARRDSLLAECTSVHGTTLKIEKITAGWSSWLSWLWAWLTGEILQFVLTSSESASALKPLADGLMKRYENHRHVAPKLLYTGRDCWRIQV